MKNRRNKPQGFGKKTQRSKQLSLAQLAAMERVMRGAATAEDFETFVQITSSMGFSQKLDPCQTKRFTEMAVDFQRKLNEGLIELHPSSCGGLEIVEVGGDA